jgi:DNA-directed RNA polymerase specialized sigma24 family protein
MTKEQTIKRDWLNRAFYAEKKLNALLYKRERDKERAQRITAVFGGNDKGRTDSRENGTEKLLTILADSEKEYDDYAAEYARIRHEIEGAIEALDPVGYAILSYRHLSYLSMEKIAEKMNYERSTIHRKYKDSLDKINNFS